jgi:hypothetical protein
MSLSSVDAEVVIRIDEGNTGSPAGTLAAAMALGAARTMN